jgi:A/G-specific adenine glycosylase
MLQQTRVAQGTPILAFSAAFPTVFDLAEANEEEVLKLWQGLVITLVLGISQNSSIRSLGVSRCFPDNYSDLLKLKGVGEYTAAAIALFLMKWFPVWNVFQVLSVILM